MIHLDFRFILNIWVAEQLIHLIFVFQLPMISCYVNSKSLS